MPAQNHRQVLVVDDDDMIRTVLADALDAEGFQIRMAANGREALELLDDWRPDVILLDLMMPEMDGWAFREHQLLREDVAHVPVIVLSARRDLSEQVGRLSAAAVLAKPFELDVLFRVISDLVSDGTPARA